MKPLRPVTGALYPLRALNTIRRNPTLWRYILVPLLLNLAVGALLYAGLFAAGLRAIDAAVTGLPGWATFLGVLLQVLLVITLLIVVSFLIVTIGVVLGAPWYARLSERLERLATGKEISSPPFSLASMLGDTWLALSYELKKLLFTLAIALPTFLLNFIPVAGTILATAGWIALGATSACLDFFGPPLERRRLGFGARLGYIRRSLPASAGFGLVCLGLTSIPFINLLVIPLCVAAGTLFFCDHDGVGT